MEKEEKDVPSKGADVIAHSGGQLLNNMRQVYCICRQLHYNDRQLYCNSSFKQVHNSGRQVRSSTR
jgi:hypothetical protein